MDHVLCLVEGGGGASIILTVMKFRICKQAFTFFLTIGQVHCLSLFIRAPSFIVLSSVATQEADDNSNNNNNNTHTQCLTKQARAATAAAATAPLLPQEASAPFIPTPPLLADCPLFEEDVVVQQPRPAVAPPRYCKFTAMEFKWID